MRYAIHSLLVRTAHAQQNFLRPHLKELGLTTGQPKVLRYLDALGPSSQRALADYCGVDPAAICRTLEGMERSGFLVRRPSETDRRSDRVELTEKGRRTLELWEAQCMVIERQMLSGFTPQERQQLALFLERAYRNVGGRFLEEESE